MGKDPSNAVQRIIDFVNTREVDEGVEHLPDAARLQAWLAEHGLAGASTALAAEDVARAHQVREALRTVLAAHHGTHHSQAEMSDANAVLTSIPLHLGFTADGSVIVEPGGAGIDAALGQLLAAIPPAAAGGTWERVKICPDDTCEWAFYDQSRNRSRRWCSMEVCGNREKSKTFRARHAPTD